MRRVGEWVGDAAGQEKSAQFACMHVSASHSVGGISSFLWKMSLCR